MELIKKTIGQCLREQAETNGERTAMEMGAWSCTYRQLDEVSDLFAGQMEGLGISRGIHVGIWSLNSPNWVFTFLALVKVGAVPILINTSLRKEEVKGILNYSQVEILFYGAGNKDLIYEDIVAEIRGDTPSVRRFLHIDELEAGTWMSERRFSARDRSPETLARVRRVKEQVSVEDAACMIFTSGTTSYPKGVLLSHYNLVNNSRAMVEAMHWTPEDKMCITVPLFHCFGITAGIIACIMGGMSMLLIPYFRTAKVWEALENGQCTILNGVPSMFLALIRKEKYASRRADSLKSGLIAGLAVTREEFLEICARFPGMHLQPAYGQTEASPCIAIADWDDSNERKAGYVGHILEHVQLRIGDAPEDEHGEAGSSCADGHHDSGETGEIEVKGYNLMLGYYNLPAATEQAFTADGWLRTGDIGYLDEEQGLHVTGRCKEMIIRAGENISPVEIEQLIRELDWVREVKVVGVPAPVVQEEIAACIVPMPGRSVDKEGLRRHLAHRLAAYKMPVYIFAFDEFPLNGCGKIHLKELKEIVCQRAQKEGKAL